jgi:hypothetical protein
LDTLIARPHEPPVDVCVEDCVCVGVSVGEDVIVFVCEADGDCEGVDVCIAVCVCEVDGDDDCGGVCVGVGVCVSVVDGDCDGVIVDERVGVAERVETTPIMLTTVTRPFLPDAVAVQFMMLPTRAGAT